MTPEEQIAKMSAAIKQAIKVMSDRFGSTEEDVARAIEAMKESMQAEPPRPGGERAGRSPVQAKVG